MDALNFDEFRDAIDAWHRGRTLCPRVSMARQTFHLSDLGILRVEEKEQPDAPPRVYWHITHQLRRGLPQHRYTSLETLWQAWLALVRRARGVHPAQLEEAIG